MTVAAHVEHWLAEFVDQDGLDVDVAGEPVVLAVVVACMTRPCIRASMPQFGSSGVGRRVGGGVGGRVGGEVGGCARKNKTNPW